MFLLLVVQWLHILAGITWFGGYIFLDFVLWPTPASAPGEACTGHQCLDSQIRRCGNGDKWFSGRGAWDCQRNLAGSHQIVQFSVWLKLRDHLAGRLGGLSHPHHLGAGWHDRVIGPVWEEDGLSPGVVGRLRLGTIFEMMCFGLVFACMVLMGVGL